MATKVENPGQSVITVQADRGDRRMAIFKLTDFPSGGPTWVFPKFSNQAHDWLPAEPTEELTVGGYGVWLFYPVGDEAAKAELHAILDTIKVQ